MNMDSAPRDGTRILIKHYTWGYNSSIGRQEIDGTSISECRWVHDRWDKQGRWTEWCGNPNTFSTATIEPLAWCHIPEELQEL